MATTEEESFMVAAHVVELVLFVISCYLIILFLRALCEVHLFMYNQKCYIINIFVACLIGIVTKCFLRLKNAVDIFPALLVDNVQGVHDLCVSVHLNMIFQLMSFADCFYSTTQTKDINKKASWIICGLLWILSYGWPKLVVYNVMTAKTSLTIQFLLNFVSWLTVLALILMGRYKYRLHAVGNVQQTYRVSVMLRTMNVLKVLAISSALRNFVLAGVLLLKTCGVDLYHFGDITYTYTVALYLLLCPIFMVKVHEELNKKVFTKRESNSLFQTSTNDGAFVVRNVMGTALSVPNERDHHFQAMTSSWNTVKSSVFKEKPVHTIKVIDL
ncbi:unnamed protein product [Bursaphelenchus okinawaensis]|uniref:Uncharacterized protein n=1 Tax=Bursaphelenchus okinawaensis TaxID=465554 RepID=A0A811K2P4_9BILA|nr:unnamed protein product [Bursaphelenchus okinawaensis]CAG9089982.1 unnamed protein product [Bursaphelenchus okinawaensis]